jgi:hypothetical protein
MILKAVNDMAGRNPMFNSSGCKDLTAYHAIGNVIKEEKELDKRVHNLISVLKFIIDWAGFELMIRQKQGKKGVGGDGT